MNPIAFEVFGLQIRWYGILISLGMVLGTLIALRRAKQVGIKQDDIIDLVLIVIPAAIIGARAYYVLFNLSYYQGDFMKMINIRQGGMAIHGGVIGGVIAGYIFCRIKKLNFFQMADLTAPSLILGQAIGRWGNYINQEAHGGPTDLPWGIVVDGVKVHPTFLYESIWNLCVFAFLIKYRNHKKYEGQLFLIYLVLYSVGRFFIEGLRIDSLMIGPLRMAQVISLGTMVVGVIIHLTFMNKKNKKI